MHVIDPDKVRLLPGQSIQASFDANPEQSGVVGFFVRSVFGTDKPNGDLVIKQRAGVIHFNDVVLVVTMLKTEGSLDEYFDIWWNYHAPGGFEQFQQMASQDKIFVHFYADRGRDFSIAIDNHFRKFFANVVSLLKTTEPWTEIEFDRAVRGMCADAYPKDNLWEMLELRGDGKGDELDPNKPKEYPGFIPPELRPFYEYLPEKGHCIKIIPSSLESEAADGNAEDFLHPAPVKTVLRCGTRWAKGFPVAPIPYIPGIGMAVPPDDTEM
ncbi:MAG: hypothetical protein AB1646_12890 [Thermodesulfobacteriota bacterium]